MFFLLSYYLVPRDAIINENNRFPFGFAFAM